MKKIGKILLLAGLLGIVATLLFGIGSICIYGDLPKSDPLYKTVEKSMVRSFIGMLAGGILLLGHYRNDVLKGLKQFIND